MSITLRTLRVFPVKSVRAREVAEVEVERLGPRGDRRWMVIDEDGEAITSRTDRRLLTITASPTANGLALTANSETTEVAVPTGEQMQVSVHGRPLRGIPAAREASEWVGAVIGRPEARLAYVGEPRPLNPDHSRPGDSTAFADAYPVTLGSMASLRRVQDWVTESSLERGEEPVQLEMTRFRPNLTIDGDLEAFAEESWQRVRVGEVELEVAKIIDRCVLTTIDPDTLDSGKEPIRSLARHHSWDGKTWFGLQLIPRTLGVIRVGDPVEPVG